MKVGALLLLVACNQSAPAESLWHCESVNVLSARLCHLNRCEAKAGCTTQSMAVCHWSPGMAAELCWASMSDCETMREEAGDKQACKLRPPTPTAL